MCRRRLGLLLLAGLQASVFNILNGNTVLQEIQTFGPALGQPQQILQARMFRLGVAFNF